jgi:hypothetical protein
MASFFRFLVDVRNDIKREVGITQDASQLTRFDNTRTNSRTKMAVNGLLNRTINGAKDFGVYVVTRHCDCPNARHKDYPISNEYGLAITYRDPNYIWKDFIFQGNRYSTCPCSAKNEKTMHRVIDDVIYDKGADVEICDTIYEILGELAEAVENAGDKSPRSGIRERLLNALLIINDAILPQSVDKYISAMASKL